MAWRPASNPRSDSRQYQSAVRLTYRLNEYIDKLVLFDGGTLGAVEVDSAKVTSRVLSLAVPKGSMTAAQKSAIGAARARAQAFGLKLTVTEF
jgi:hypothetical protein